MAAPASPHSEDRGANKRQKGDELSGQHIDEGAPSYPQRPSQQRYPPQSYGAPQPMQQAGNYMWGQYGGGPPPPPPHGWGQQGPPPPSGPLYPPRGPPGERPPDWNYRGHPSGPPPVHGHGRAQAPPPLSTPANGKIKSEGPMDEDSKSSRHPQQYPGWSPHGGPQWQHPPPYGVPPGGGWQSNGPPIHQTPPPMYQGSNWTGKSPPRGRARPEVMNGYPRTEMDISYLSTRSVGPPHDDDGASSSAGGSIREKGRGSYKCGRCGVPKKGHVCPYQPKLKRRPDEPPPELRNAAVQVEMDEFLTLRRLNIKIQGLPESYASEPYLGENMVVGEPHPLSGPLPLPSETMSTIMLSNDEPMHSAGCDNDSSDLMDRDPPPLTAPSSSPRADGSDIDDNDGNNHPHHHHRGTQSESGVRDDHIEGVDCAEETTTV